jgi:hypothetical protein
MPPPGSSVSVGVFTSLPIVWPEAHDIRSQLSNQSPPHWALGVLRQSGEVMPLNSLTEIPKLKLLILAQPRPLSPLENVALDDWVQRGGRVLLFADPMLTAESAFALGDKRRPQDVVLLSPILSRWGLELTFDEDRPVGGYAVKWPGGALPVNLPGRFRLGKVSRHCRLVAEGLGAKCRIGMGLVLAIADAALLEDSDPAELGQRPVTLNALIEQALTGD